MRVTRLSPTPKICDIHAIIENVKESLVTGP